MTAKTGSIDPSSTDFKPMSDDSTEAKASE
jgi:hypothetical protein